MEKIKEPYSLSVGAYQYIMVPVTCTIGNFNYQIAFDGNHNIVGFSYEEYAAKEPIEDNSIPEEVTETEYSFSNDGFVIPGTFTTPKEGSNYPVVILVQGFGASDRDESIYENKPFRDIAWDLAKQGIASYRYDKRSYLYSERMAKDKTATIKDEIIDDTVAATQMVKKLEEVDNSRIYILGHSLGGYVIPRIAQELPEVSGYIFMAAPAEHVKNYILDQYNYLAYRDENLTKEEQEEQKTLRNDIDLLDKPKDIPQDKMILGAYKDYWIDLADYYPIKAAKKIKVPVLVLQGERDYQVTMKQYNKWKDNFEDSDNWIFHSYVALNHFMIAGAGEPKSEEYRARAHVDTKVTQDITQFIKDSKEKDLK
ncbi:alpha/beta fold hydrolase [Anaerocolumna sedimenticola]|uniref:Alpha/beta fold hydrolase n=1 Tax=Anaerocolumna sedimenticola TaxID=2696063 RepID=A0A6P1TIG4_9FIRM|nr:alpha/beta fold hydrolase [Anaerocolumna sedimenticola]QHQ61000.1 alpha/beta fold hydrolase [Anaerocolumna sedimenticola]